MPKDYPRSLRIAEQIQRELADILRLELKDPRVGMITITEVQVSPDNKHAKVFFTLLGDAVRIEQTIDGLRSAAGFLRTQLAHRLKLRTMPEIHFAYDNSVEHGAKLSRLIDEAVGGGPKTSTDE